MSHKYVIELQIFHVGKLKKQNLLRARLIKHLLESWYNFKLASITCIHLKVPLETPQDWLASKWTPIQLSGLICWIELFSLLSADKAIVPKMILALAHIKLKNPS